MRRLWIIFLGSWLLPVPAKAAVVVIATGVRTSVPQVIAGLVDFLLLWSGVIASGLFLIGAVLMVGSGGEDEYLSAGKRIMKAALIGFALVLSSWMILSTVVYFLVG